jgi:hypothetical protein
LCFFVHSAAITVATRSHSRARAKIFIWRDDCFS